MMRRNVTALWYISVSTGKYNGIGWRRFRTSPSRKPSHHIAALRRWLTVLGSRFDTSILCKAHVLPRCELDRQLDWVQIRENENRPRASTSAKNHRLFNV
ncbi:uncharacterized protein PHALS_04427 [Plasmopara halstedii]|uniref:Uncharacterized protein n=1 Tax=Plasmopara halstedii TaxID=4781 RepID=A0A0P1B0W3_PLAHL|nr:uncharacterized protein PHALS_04427 [Plasmopara halstedii]CEG47559.1 hypothetical protein PHALS_04427 [Plasmopara halstedii]|eukprot:XP_024583928.1 hypothetical protein PHALS_04427 [Plasmopara halstedii]